VAIDTIEISEEDAAPVLLFLYEVGVIKYPYTTADMEIEKDGVIYSPSEVLESSSIEASADKKGAPLSITTDVDFEIAKIFLNDAPHTSMKLTIFLGHLGEAEYRVLWKGKVTNVNRVEDHKANISHEQNISIVNRGGLTYRYGANCNHSVYRGGCNLDFNANATDGTIQNIVGPVITATEFGLLPVGDLVGGIAVFNSTYYRMIIAHDANDITLARGIPGLAIGSILKVASGCDKTVARCKVLGNFDNNLSFNTVPERNPFSGLSARANNTSGSAGSWGSLTNGFEKK
jgi:hypothetical protein